MNNSNKTCKGEKNKMSDTQKNTKSEADLLKSLGIDEGQVQVKEKVAKETEINDNADQLKADLKTSTRKVNEKNGKNVSFIGLKREGSLKDANGKVIKDEDGKPKPRYVKTRQSGHWTIDKTKDGFFRMTRAVHYTESFLVADFTEMG